MTLFYNSEKKPFIQPALEELIELTFHNLELYKEQVNKESTKQFVLFFSEEVINNVK